MKKAWVALGASALAIVLVASTFDAAEARHRGGGWSGGGAHRRSASTRLWGRDVTAQALKVRAQFGRSLVAQVSVLLERLADNLVKLRR